MPLLVGLFESSARRSLENALPMQSTNGIDEAELEEIAAKRSSGGGILDSTANMANSILGAGNAHVMALLNYSDSCCSSFIHRHYWYTIRLRLLLRLLTLVHPGLPYAVSQAGFVTGLVLLVILCGVTDWTIRLIVVNAKLSGRSSYIEIMDHCFGPSGRAAVSFFQFSFAFGGTYCIILDDEFPVDMHCEGMCAFGIIIGWFPPIYSRNF